MKKINYYGLTYIYIEIYETSKLLKHSRFHCVALPFNLQKKSKTIFVFDREKNPIKYRWKWKRISFLMITNKVCKVSYSDSSLIIIC